MMGYIHKYCACFHLFCFVLTLDLSGSKCVPFCAKCKGRQMHPPRNVPETSPMCNIPMYQKIPYTVPPPPNCYQKQPNIYKKAPKMYQNVHVILTVFASAAEYAVPAPNPL